MTTLLVQNLFEQTNSWNLVALCLVTAALSPAGLLQEKL